jgi:hypothetical protein
MNERLMKANAAGSDREPLAWLYQVRGTGECGLPATEWRNYGVYLKRSEAESGLKHAGAGLDCRVLALYGGLTKEAG